MHHSPMPKIKSQIEFVLVLVDESHNYSIINYKRSKYKRSKMSFMAAEIPALLCGLDNTKYIHHFFEDFPRKFEINAFLGSKTLLNVMRKNGSTLEKRVHIVINSRILLKWWRKTLLWIPGTEK